MSKQTIGLRVAGAIFALFSLVHLLRVGARIEVTIAGNLVPMWPSLVAAIIGVVLAVWLWRLSSRGSQP